MQHPAKNYILYLLSRRSYCAEAVVAQLQDLSFPIPREKLDLDLFINSIRHKQHHLQFPAGYNPKNLGHQPTTEFLRKLHIHDIWAADPYVHRAMDWLAVPAVRRMLEILLLGPLKMETISRRVADRHGLPPELMNTRVVKAYSHYFWNYDDLNREEWLRILGTWGTPEVTADLQTSLLSPRSSSGAALSLWLADGGAGESLRDTTMFTLMRDISFMHFMKIAFDGRYVGESKSKAMYGFVQSMIASQEQLDMRRGGSAELLDELRRFETSYDTSRLTTISDLPLPRALPVKVDVVEQEQEHDDAINNPGT